MDEKVSVYRPSSRPGGEVRDIFDSMATVKVDEVGSLRVVGLGDTTLAWYAPGGWLRATNGSQRSEVVS